jgi:hypothetical protein
MTRDARLSALHRGDFRPGAALPSPALPPDPYSDAPRSQVIMPGGRCPGPPEPAVTSRGRRTPLPAPPFRIVSRRRPSMSEDGNLCTIYSLRSQEISSDRSQTRPPGLCGRSEGRRDIRICAATLRLHRPLKTASQRTNMRNPGWSPTTVMCPLQGAVSSNRKTLPGRSCLVSPSVTVMEKLPCKTMPN